MIPRRLAEDSANPLRRALLELESRKLARYELETCRQFDRVVWVTEEDRAAVYAGQPNPASFSMSDNGRHHSHDLVIPICVDPEDKPAIERRAGTRRVTFLGGLHWPPNAEGVTWFVREVWPLVERHSPDAKLTLIGRDPPQELVELDRISDSIEVLGYVDDPERYLKETAVFIVPLLAGGGMRVKIIDAWSWGLPVVSTTIGAEGIGYQHGKDILIADTPDAFAEAVSQLINEPEVANTLGAAGRRTVVTRYDWRTIYRAWDQLYARTVSLETNSGNPLLVPAAHLPSENS
jgi:glycosyltransferase involved in cell wall biosynthesis